jgi:hypothetical protein
MPNNLVTTPVDFQGVPIYPQGAFGSDFACPGG